MARWTARCPTGGGLSIILPYAVANTSSSRLSGQHEWRFGCRVPLADKHLRRSRAHARTIPLVRPADIFEFPSLRRNAARHLQSDIADQSEREPLDGLADHQLQLYARPRLDMDRDLFHRAVFHEQQQFLRKRGTKRPTLTTMSAVRRESMERHKTMRRARFESGPALAQNHLPRGRTYKPLSHGQVLPLAWGCVCGAAPISVSITSASSPSPQASRILKQSAFRSGRSQLDMEPRS
jgi:hypothetical protein